MEYTQEEEEKGDCLLRSARVDIGDDDDDDDLGLATAENADGGERGGVATGLWELASVMMLFFSSLLPTSSCLS